MAVSSQFAKFNKTTKSQMLDICGEPLEKRTEGDTELWLYKFITEDALYRVGVSIRFDSDDKYTGIASDAEPDQPVSYCV